MSETLTDFEMAVMQMVTRGDHPAFEALRDQLGSCRVTKREFTGVGFFSDLVVDRSAARVLPPAHNARISDVVAELVGLEHGAGFILFVDDGYMTMLEGFSYDEPWPVHVTGYELRYMGGTRDLSELGT